MSMISLNSGPPWNISLTVEEVGQDFLCRIHGGAWHVGAVALSHWTHEQAHTCSLTAGRHKEGPITEHAAHILCAATRRSVSCLSGIHFDSLTREEIEEISTTAGNLMARAAEQLKRSERIANVPECSPAYN